MYKFNIYIINELLFYFKKLQLTIINSITMMSFFLLFS